MIDTTLQNAPGAENMESGLSLPLSDTLSGAATGGVAPAFDQNGGDVRKWFVLHTKSRQEKVICDFFRERQVEYLLPLVAKTTYYGKRKVKSQIPLFPGYVFVRTGIHHAYAADRTHRLVRIIPVFDQARIEEELRSLTRTLDAEQPFDRHPHLVKGVRVEVKSGPLQGVRGVVESRLKMDRLVLQVEILGQAISVEVDTDLLVVLEDAPAVAENTKGGVRAA
jgi:transcriptional antiterminator RfaH